MAIVLTGATGFLGSAILEKLLDRGDRVIAIKRSTSSIERIGHCLKNPALQCINIDIEDPHELFAQNCIDTIIHTATEYGRAATPLFSILNANLLLPLQLAELGLQHGVRCFINTDSFFNKSGNSYSNLLNYSLSKKSLLIWLNKLAGKLRVINVVLEHLYGAGDSSSKFVESIVRKVGVEQVPHISLTHGYQRRDFIFLDDVVNAYLRLVDYGRTEDFLFESFELGTGNATQVRDLVEMVKTVSGSQTFLAFGELPYRDDEIMSSKADISRIEGLGWSPSITLREGISQILSSHLLSRNSTL